MIKENVSLSFSPEFEIKESENGKTLTIGGTALVEGKSVNKINYRLQNLQENDQKPFKWLVGHPKTDVEDHVVGKGKLAFVGEALTHDGLIMNTARHPDVIEKVRAGLLGPSIHATAKKITSSDDGYLVEGLSIGGVGLVAFQGVKSASIDYAIAESFKIDETEEPSTDENKDQGDNMPEDEPKPEGEDKKEEEKKTEEPEAPEAPAEEGNKNEDRIKVLESEIAALKDGKKVEIVESIVKMNKDLKKEDLLKESEDKLETIKLYEEKLSKVTSEAGIVESDETTEKPLVVEQEDGSVSLSESAYKDFNKEIMERIR